MQRGEGGQWQEGGGASMPASVSTSTTQAATVVGQLRVAGRLAASAANGHTPTAVGKF